MTFKVYAGGMNALHLTNISSLDMLRKRNQHRTYFRFRYFINRTKMIRMSQNDNKMIEKLRLHEYEIKKRSQI